MKIVAAAFLSRKRGEEMSNPKLQYPNKSQACNSQISHAFDPLGIWLIGICLELGCWGLGFRSKSICGFADQFPCLVKMRFGSEHVPEADSHHRSAAQFCLREISAAARVNPLHDVAV